MNEKKEIRQTIKQHYRDLAPKERQRLSREATERLLHRLSLLPTGTRVALFLSMWDEPDTQWAVEQLYAKGDLRLLVPRVEGEVMRFYPYDPQQLNHLSDYGIVEPSQTAEEEEVPTVIVVPGVAFDSHGGRVGRGKGFYDKYFALHSAEISRKVALTLSFQLWDAVPTEPHDIRMDEIITDQVHLTLTPLPPPTPCYVMEEGLLRRNLSLIKGVADAAGVEIILAFKAFALHRSFPIFREYISSSTASSVNEALLAYHEMKSLAHTYAPAYKESDFPTILACSSHITFNTPQQFGRFFPMVQAFKGHAISCGIRINPEYSEVGTDLYNPCAPGSRMGTVVDELPNPLPAGVEGLHFHTHCESKSYDLEKTLQVIEERFAAYLPQVKWINMGGGHLMTHKEYDTAHLVSILRAFKERHPHLKVILEPGSAFAWQTGYLATTVLDVVENKGIRTLIIDASFTCHMPDCLEMPYQPAVRGAHMAPTAKYSHAYRIGGNSCLSGDVIGDWYFDHEVEVGESIVFEDMIHYTTVKTSMFNGISHPSIYLHALSGEWIKYREYSYEDYHSRMC